MEQLVQLVGDDTAKELATLFGGRLDAIKLRRVQGKPGNDVINFHLDAAERTMQVPLNGEDEYQGGRLVFATNQGMLCPIRRAGSYTLHDNTVPHGVTPLTGGVRYGLFLLQNVHPTRYVGA
mmetsp:Transcript_74901/g.175776  ORF Transcript_74901/g.175776 Transcript_74901/m.175776 type:complete len:122 (+) Transcript_74901:2-367(+)